MRSGRHQLLEALLTVLKELSGVHRQVIQRRLLDGLSVAETAARLETSDAAVVALTRRASDALRKSMDRLGEFPRGP